MPERDAAELISLSHVPTASLSASVLGGKGLLTAQGLADHMPMLDGFVVPTVWFRRHLARAANADTLERALRKAKTEGAISRVRDRVLQTPLEPELLQQLTNAFARLQAPHGVAVRSSASAEDGARHSMAGLGASVLCVRDLEALAAAIPTVWGSLFLPAALSYLRHANLLRTSMAVVVQPMVNAEAAGVIFTHTVAGQRRATVHACFGLGSAVVDGSAAMDTLEVDLEQGLVVHQNIAEKHQAMVAGAHGVEASTVPGGIRRSPSLSPAALRALITTVQSVDRLHPPPWDIEFAIARSGEVVILQQRPVTQALPVEQGSGSTVWSRTNLSEALPGVATPLTWSVASAFSEQGFRSAFAALGCPVPRNAQLVGRVDGRIYLNLSTFVEITAQLPGFDVQHLVPLTGGIDAAAMSTLSKIALEASSRGVALRAPVALTRAIAQRVRHNTKQEVARIEQEHGRLTAIDLGILPSDGLATTWSSALSLLHSVGDVMLRTAGESLASFLLLRLFIEARVAPKLNARQVEAGFPEPTSKARSPSSIARTLLSGQGRVESAEIGEAVLKVAAELRRDAALLEHLARDPSEVGRLPSGPLRDAFEGLLARFGDRGPREAELAEPRWREAPSTLVQMIIAAARAPEHDDVFAVARAHARTELSIAESVISITDRWALHRLIALTAQATRTRELLRAWVTRALGNLRRIALEIDQRLVRFDRSIEKGSVFFCTSSELETALRHGQLDLGSLIRSRKAEFVAQCARPDPPPSFVGSPANVDRGLHELHGRGASDGVAEGPVRLLVGRPDLDDVKPGDIVVARSADISLTPLFSLVGGLVTELGGVLSHAAIVAREYGLPYVAGATHATERLRTGDQVRINGRTGSIEIIERPPVSMRPPPLRLDG